MWLKVRRDLGSVVVIAERATKGEPNGKYIPGIARGVQAGDTIQALERLGLLRRDAVQMIIRNAGAHAGVRVLDTGVAMTQRRIENGVVVGEQTVEMSDAEFAEEFTRVNEACLALQLGIIPWLFTHQSAHVVRARQDASPTLREREGLVRLLAGLQGLLHVVVEHVGNALIVGAKAAESTDVSSPLIPSLVPVIFHSWADVDSVTLNIGARNPVTYERVELPDVDPLSGQQDLVAVGLMGRRWLGDLSGDAAIEADITYLVRPQLNAIIEAFRHVSTSSASGAVVRIAEAHARLLALNNQVRRAKLPPPGTVLVAEVREAIQDGARLLDQLQLAFVGSDARERQRQALTSAAFVNRLEDIDRRVVDEFARVQGNEKG